MIHVSTFSASVLRVLVVFSLTVVAPADQNFTDENPKTNHLQAQDLSTHKSAHSVRTEFPSSFSSPLSQTVPAVPHKSSPETSLLPSRETSPPPSYETPSSPRETTPSPFRETSHSPSPETSPLPPQETSHYPYYHSTISKFSDENTCDLFDGDMDALTLDQFSSKLTHQCRYDKVTRPDHPTPLPVSIQMDIKHIEAIEHLQFKLHMLIQYRYVDYRLRYNHISPKRGVMLGEELLRNKIWVPHIILSNERDSAVMGLGGNDIFVSITPEGEVLYSYRMKATIYCWMDLKKFPFDTQNCNLVFRSWTYNASRLVLQWDEDEPVKIANQLHLTEFTLTRFSTFANVVEASLSRGAFVGNYSVVVFEFILQREIGYYIMDYFIPSILLVATSWVTFWLQADNAAPRITLGTSTMLAFITLAQGQAKNLPKVSYIKASEIWFLSCTVFIFLSMAEFAFVNIIWRRKKKVEMKKPTGKNILKCALTPRLARRELQRSSSINNLHKSHSCSSLSHNGSSNKKNSMPYNNYLTVHSFPSTINLPTITTQSDDNLVNSDSQVTIPVPDHKCEWNEDIPQIQRWTSMTPQEVAIWIDKRSRLVFPCAFLVFNIFYWAFVYGL